jgi:hypothetical protein
MTWVPQACTLPTAEQPLRVAEFDGLFARAVRAAERTDATGLRIHLPSDEETADVARDLIDRETACCSFFDMELRASTGTTELAVRVPPAQVAVLDALQQRAETVRTARRSGW